MIINYTFLLGALLPVAILLLYICYKDKNQPEPIGLLIKSFFYGILSAFLSFAISIPSEAIGLYSSSATTIWGNICHSFFGAAIPEEIAKFVMLWLVLRKNKYFDEKMDGIVYAVFVSLGFAALENILYLWQSESFMTTAIVRALFAVPGHFCYGILMGYYYSLAKFYPRNQTKNKILILVAPIIVHGLYDAILFIMNVTPTLACILVVLFLVFCYKIWKYCSKLIQEHIERDSADNISIEDEQIA